MDRPRPSVSVTSLCSDSSDDSEDTVSSTAAPVPAFPPPPSPVTVDVDRLTVNEGGTGILNGNTMNLIVNQYIMPNGDALSPQGLATGLVLDAVKINSETNRQFFQNGKVNAPSINILGNKEGIEVVQRRWCCWLLLMVLLLSLIPLMSSALLSVLTTRPSTLTPDSPYNIDVNPADLPEAPRMVSRTTWLAQPPMGSLDNNSLPVDMVIVCHTATATCLTTPDCVYVVRNIQQFHVESRKWYDIGYNFLVGGDGAVYEGRGWDYEGAHTKHFNNGTLGVAFIGTFVKELPSPVMLEAFHRLINLGVKIGKISRDYQLFAQCQLQPTSAPGLALARNMTSWPHFNNSLPFNCE